MDVGRTAVFRWADMSPPAQGTPYQTGLRSLQAEYINQPWLPARKRSLRGNGLFCEVVC